MTATNGGALEFRVLGNFLDVYEVWGSYGSPVPPGLDPDVNLDLDALVVPSPLMYWRLALPHFTQTPGGSQFQGIVAFGIPYTATQSFHLTLQMAVYEPLSFTGYSWSAATEILR